MILSNESGEWEEVSEMKPNLFIKAPGENGLMSVYRTHEYQVISEFPEYWHKWFKDNPLNDKGN